MNELFIERIKQYFGQNSDKYLKLLNEPYTQGFFLNTNKANKQDIFNIIDFDYKETNLTNSSYYHDCESIGKTKAYELGLIYPQEIAASMPSTFINDRSIKRVVDLCSAPGGKTINIANKLDKDTLFICNEINHTRALTLSSNLERLGIDNCIITCKQTNKFASQLENFADLVILDAPCSGEGIIRKYPEILDEYSLNNINSLASIQNNLLEDAYKILNNNGYLLYSTCTYSYEEDEDQIISFLNRHNDIELIELENSNTTRIKGCIKLSPLNNTEGQFICLMKKKGNSLTNRFKLLKEDNNNIVKKFIDDNLNIKDYYLYKCNDRYYISFIPLLDLKDNVLKYGIHIGEITNNRFEPSHSLYRSNQLANMFKNIIEINDNDYDKYISGNELNVNCNNGYYLVRYKGYTLGYGKVSNNKLKNKYPKGLRRVI